MFISYKLKKYIIKMPDTELQPLYPTEKLFMRFQELACEQAAPDPERFFPAYRLWRSKAGRCPILFNACRTAAYIPIATDGSPFSTFHRVARLISALSATSAVDRLLRSLASFICSPIVSSICGTAGQTIARRYRLAKSILQAT